MTVEALIQDGVVVQVAAERFDVNPALSWATGPDGTAVRDRYDGSNFSKPVAAPPPSARIVSAAEFMALFTPAQTAALWSADPLLMTGAIRVMVQGTANLDSPDASSLLTLAVTKGVLTDADKARILAGQQPASA